MVRVVAVLAGLLILAGVLTAGLATMLLFSDDNAPVMFEGVTVAPLPTLEADRAQRGGRLYADHCANCHGKQLEGAPDWRYRQADGTYPPTPLDSAGHTWQHPDATLIRMIANGINPQLKGGMPAFREKMTANDMVEILTYLKTHWGQDERRRQWWQSQTGSEVPPK